MLNCSTNRNSSILFSFLSYTIACPSCSRSSHKRLPRPAANRNTASSVCWLLPIEAACSPRLYSDIPEEQAILLLFRNNTRLKECAGILPALRRHKRLCSVFWIRPFVYVPHHSCPARFDSQTKENRMHSVVYHLLYSLSSTSVKSDLLRRLYYNRPRNTTRKPLLPEVDKRGFFSVQARVKGTC